MGYTRFVDENGDVVIGYRRIEDISTRTVVSQNGLEVETKYNVVLSTLDIEDDVVIFIHGGSTSERIKYEHGNIVNVQSHSENDSLEALSEPYEDELEEV